MRTVLETKTTLLIVLLLLLGVCARLGANPVPDPAYDLKSESLVISLNKIEGRVKATFVFSKTGFFAISDALGSKLVDTVDFGKLPKKEQDNFLKEYSVKIYLLVYVPEKWKPSAGTVSEIFSVKVAARHGKRKEDVTISSADEKKLGESSRRFLPEIKGIKPYWFVVSLRKGFFPDEFSLDVEYTQPVYFLDGKAYFSYLPLLPIEPKGGQSDYIIKIVNPPKKKLAVVSRHKIMPKKSEEETVFIPSDQEVITLRLN